VVALNVYRASNVPVDACNSEPFWSFERLGRGHISVSSISLPFISGQAVDSG